MAEETILKITSMVKKSNLLARAAWSPESVWESRLVAIIASQVHKDDIDFASYTVLIKDLLAFANISNTGRIYDALDKLTDKAMTRLIKIKEGKKWIKYTLFSRCEYEEGSGEILLQFHPDLKPHYLDLQKHFKTYSLQEYLSLPSSYSQRIYEILRSWDDCVSTDISVKDLHDMLCTPPSLQSDFFNFRRRVLEKAHKDITEKTKLRYEWEGIKKGRKFTHVRFVFGTKIKAAVAKSNKLAANKKILGINNKYFADAAACASKHNNECGSLKGTFQFCKGCWNYGTTVFADEGV